MISAGDIRNGITFEMDGKVMQVIEFQHVKPGKGAAFVRVKMRNVITGGVTETSLNPSAKFPTAFIERKKMEKSGAKAYLVNTGWNGSGKRISIKDTRGIIDAILDGSILKAETKKIPYFDFEVPTALPGVDTNILDPRNTYADASEWETKAKDLSERFVKNFVKYTGNDAGKALVAAGPVVEE